jgi:hypothetical protein
MIPHQGVEMKASYKGFLSGCTTPVQPLNSIRSSGLLLFFLTAWAKGKAIRRFQAITGAF